MAAPETASALAPEVLKSCCADAYSGEWARLLLGDAFHPGGAALTERLGRLLGLAPGMRVLDVAAGKGTSALFLARTFGCAVVGVDYADASVREAAASAEAAGLAHLVRFEQGDAERLDFPNGAFDAAICECAFCTFPDKRAAAQELARVLSPGGVLGLSDLTRTRAVPAELQGLLAWIACIADALPLAEYMRILADAGLAVTLTELHDEALAQLVRDVRAKLMGAELLVRLKQIELPGADFEQARALARAAARAIDAGTFGYAVLAAAKPA
jgi:ubiquinone/menaquinone biosynthesis C-methylase UbiE